MAYSRTQIIGLVISWILIVAYAGFIFQLSSAPIKSQGPVVKTMYEQTNTTIIQPTKSATGQQDRNTFTSDFFHFYIYLVFGGLLCLGVYQIRTHMASRYRPIIAWAIGSVYGATDEVHQYYVPGRNSGITDVGIDSFGILIGVLLAVAVFILIKMLIENPAEDPVRRHRQSVRRMRFGGLTLMLGISVYFLVGLLHLLGRVHIGASGSMVALIASPVATLVGALLIAKTG